MSSQTGPPSKPTSLPNLALFIYYLLGDGVLGAHNSAELAPLPLILCLRSSFFSFSDGVHFSSPPHCPDGVLPSSFLYRLGFCFCYPSIRVPFLSFTFGLPRPCLVALFSLKQVQGISGFHVRSSPTWVSASHSGAQRSESAELKGESSALLESLW